MTHGVTYDFDISDSDFQDPEFHVGEFEAFKEHGMDWYSCISCGASWAIVETTNGRALEEVSVGDESCSDVLRNQEEMSDETGI